jgi:hypothetical protein
MKGYFGDVDPRERTSIRALGRHSICTLYVQAKVSSALHLFYYNILFIFYASAKTRFHQIHNVAFNNIARVYEYNMPLSLLRVL